jgi:uncharacterized membrane protein
MMGYYGYGPAAMLCILGGLVLAGLVIFLVAGFLKDRNPRQGGKGNSQALMILDEAYARGQVTDEEYTRRKDILRR